MMTDLDQAISHAYGSQGKQEDVNKVYLTLLRTSFFLPIKKTDPGLRHVEEQEPFQPLFAKVDGKYFMLIFDQLDRLTAWAGDQLNEMDYVELMGKEVIAGINDEVFLCLNIGTEFYKEFSPDEVRRLKIIVGKIEQLKRV